MTKFKTFSDDTKIQTFLPVIEEYRIFFFLGPPKRTSSLFPLLLVIFQSRSGSKHLIAHIALVRLKALNFSLHVLFLILDFFPGHPTTKTDVTRSVSDIGRSKDSTEKLAKKMSDLFKKSTGALTPASETTSKKPSGSLGSKAETAAQPEVKTAPLKTAEKEEQKKGKLIFDLVYE
jgi:hypothetical protein